VGADAGPLLRGPSVGEGAHTISVVVAFCRSAISCQSARMKKTEL
jgi:hypothetical protein